MERQRNKDSYIKMPAGEQNLRRICFQQCARTYTYESIWQHESFSIQHTYEMFEIMLRTEPMYSVLSHFRMQRSRRVGITRKRRNQMLMPKKCVCAREYTHTAPMQT